MPVRILIYVNGDSEIIRTLILRLSERSFLHIPIAVAIPRSVLELLFTSSLLSPSNINQLSIAGSAMRDSASSLMIQLLLMRWAAGLSNLSKLEWR